MAAITAAIYLLKYSQAQIWRSIKRNALEIQLVACLLAVNTKLYFQNDVFADHQIFTQEYAKQNALFGK